MHHHARHVLNLLLQFLPQCHHRLCDRMPIGKDHLKRNHNSQIIIPVDDMLYTGRADAIDLFQFLCNNVYDTLNHRVVDNQFAVVAEYGMHNRAFP